MNTQFGTSQIGDEEIKVENKIGEGFFGSVYRGQCRGCTVAVKIPHRAVSNPSQFIREVKVLSNLHHPNVCLFMGACLSPKKVMIVSELMKGDVEGLLLDKSNRFKLSELIGMAVDAARGMAWLHGNNPPIYHRDLKTANLLYDENRKIKVCDFGLADIKPSEGRELYDMQPKGTPLYMAPEVMMKESITEKADVYSFGIVMWEILTRTQAYTGFKDFRSFKRATIELGHRCEIPGHWPEALKKLVARCWDANPSKRPTFEEVVKILEEIFLGVELKEFEDAVGEKILESSARNFWKAHFLKSHEVPWELFEKKLLEAFGMAHLYTVESEKNCGMPTPEECSIDQLKNLTLVQLEQFSTSNSKCMVSARDELMRRMLIEDPAYPESPLSGLLALRAILTNDRGVVIRDVFGKVTECFGPVNAKMMDRVRETIRSSYFHGFMATDVAFQILKVRKAGTYLLRFSNNRAFSLILSFVNQKRVVQHRVIAKGPQGYYSDIKKPFDSVMELIDQYFEEELNLEFPLPNRAFSFIFTDDCADRGGYEEENPKTYSDELNKLYDAQDNAPK